MDKRLAIFSSPNQLGAEFHSLCSLCGMDCRFHYSSTNSHVVESACINWLCHLVQNEGSAHFYRASSRSIARQIKNHGCMPNPIQRNQKGYLHVQLHFFSAQKINFLSHLPFRSVWISYGEAHEVVRYHLRLVDCRLLHLGIPVRHQNEVAGNQSSANWSMQSHLKCQP